jgi:hypothetical protein
VDFQDWKGRALGLTESPIYISNSMLLLLFPVGGVLLMGHLKRDVSFALAGLVLLFTLSLYYSLTRSWTYAAIAGTLPFLILYRGKYLRDFWTLLIVGCCLFLMWTTYEGNRYTQGPNSDSSASGRFVLWELGLRVALDNPVLGVGHNVFKSVSQDYSAEIDEETLERQDAAEVIGVYEPHNDFLNIWLSFGSAALCLYVAIFYIAGRNFLRAFGESRSPQIKGVAMGGVGALIAFAVNSSFHNLFDSTLTLWLLAGLSLALVNLAAPESRPDQPATWPVQGSDKRPPQTGGRLRPRSVPSPRTRRIPAVPALRPSSIPQANLASTKVVSEREDDLRDLIVNLGESFEDWALGKWHTVGGTVERYRRGQLRLHAHLRAFPLGNDFEFDELCALFEFDPSIDTQNIDLDTRRYEYSHFRILEVRGRKQQELVFIGVVECVKQKQGAVAATIPSLVRLKRLDACPERSGQTLKQSAPIEEIVPPETGRGRTILMPCADPANEVNREGRPLVWVWSRIKSKLPSKIVQRSSQVVGNVSHNGANAGINVAQYVDGERALACTRVQMANKFVRLAFHEGLDCRLELIEMILGPKQSLPESIESIHEFDLPYRRQFVRSAKDKARVEQQSAAIRLVEASSLDEIEDAASLMWGLDAEEFTTSRRRMVLRSDSEPADQLDHIPIQVAGIGREAT